MACPNINLDSWKNLVAARGEDVAYYLWDRYEGEVPQEEYISSTQDNINKSFFQLDRSKLPAAQEKLDNQLLGFLSQFGVTSKEIDNFKERFGIDALGATDVMQKLIYLSSRRNITTIPEEAAHMMVMLMGKDHPLIIESFNNIEKWSGYENIKKQYMPIYKDENKVKVEALGHLIRDAVINKYTSNNSVEKSLFQKIKELVENFLKGIRTKFGVKKNDELVYDKQAVMKIAEGMLSGDSSMVTSQRSFKYSTNVDYYKALEKDPLSKSIVNKYTEKLPFKLAGSLAIAKQTNIERWHGEQIHDLDFKVEQSWIDENGEEAFDKILDKPNIIKIREIYNENSSYHTKSYLEAPEGYRIEKKGKTISSSSPMLDMDIYDDKGNKLSTMDAMEKVKALDFFIGGNPETSFENVASWQDIFQGKLSLSPIGEKEVMFDRAKDQTDYINVIPVNIQESKTKNLYFQTEEMPASKASPELVEKIKALAKKMGVSIQGLAEYAKQRGLDVGGVNGVADMVRNIIAVAEGKEDVAITEEMVHIATAMLEQSRPDVVTSMISKIDRFKIYKLVLEKYKNNKNYQLPNGKPDIRKIKKEAVDKLITELIVRDAQDTTDFPELLEEEQRNFVQKLWDAIKDVVRMMYTSSNINIFEETAATIMAGEISPEAFEKAKAEGKIADELFLQIEKNDAVDGIYDTVMSEHGKMKLDPGEVDASGKVIRKRGYTYDGQEVAKSVTQKIKEDVKMPERTGLLKEQDEQKRAWGDEGHTYVKNFISANLIDENGYARTTPLNNRIATNLNDDVREKLDAFAKELINSYPKGTRFVIEKMVINKKAKGMIGSTVDFMAIEPITKADGTKDAKVDVLDWKFTSINKSVADDIPWYKQKEWKAQMGEYSKIMYNYGVKPTQLRKTRMVPFQSNYLYAIPGDPSSGLVLTSIEIGKLDNIEETNLYLLPVPLNTESTGNEKVDRLLASLRRWHEKLYKTLVSEEQKATKNIQLNQISTAIRKLHLQLDFAPLASVGVTFLNNAKETLNSFENIDYTKLSAEELRKKLGDLLEYQKSAEKFSNLDDVFLSYVSKEGMTEEDKNILNSLEKVAASTERMVDRITAVQREFVVQLALKERVTTEATKETILDAEKEVGTFTKTFLEASKLPNKIIKLAANLLMNAKSLVERRINKLVDEYSKVLLPVEEEAKAKGVSAFDLIGRVEDGDLKLIKKIDPKFYKAYNDAIAKKDKAFFLENLDIDKYNALMEEFLNKSVETINNTEFSPNESDDIARKKFEIEKLRNSVNINLSTFNGYNDYNFRRLFRQAMLEEKNYSEDYKNMSPAAKDLWDFMVALNQKAINMGYLKDRGLSFFPLMEASAIHRLMQSDSLLTEGKDLFKDGYTAKINERQGLSKIDVETGQVERTIPRLFTRTDKDVKQLSKDLTKVGTLWIKSLLEYESAREMENTMLTLHSVEKAKGHIMVDENENIIFESGVPKIDERTNKSADIFETIIDDAIYGMRENLTSIGNIGISKISEKMKGDEETKEQRKVNIKKALNNGNKLTQSLAVGLKALVALPNYFGYHFQTFINSGNLYRFREFEKNHGMITTGIGLTEIDKGLIHEFVPLNEDVTKEKRRELAKKQSYIKWLASWNFSDIMMITNAFPEKKLQLTNAKTIIDNSMIVDGRIVSIRQHLKAMDRETRKGMSESQRKELERSFEARVKELKETKSLPKVAKIENDDVVIPGVSEQELAKFRTKIVEYSRNLNGQMSDVNKADYRRDTILKSFMMFKNWIPKQISLRTLDIQKNNELDEWEYGRTRLFVKTWYQLGFTGIFRMRQVIQGTDEGIAIMNEMLQEKREAYYKRTGQELEITDEEFYDLVRTQLSNQMKELGLLLLLMTVLLAAKAAVPPDDATDLEKNRYKWWMKLTNKTYDEVAFYYNPISFEGTTSGSVLPSLSLLSKTEKIFVNLGKASYAVAMDDDELWEKTHTAKYFMDVIPGVSQFNKEVLPFIDPELAKELGIRVSAEARANR